MHQIFNRVGRFDNSPFQFGKSNFSMSVEKITENYERYVALRSEFSGRLDSNHLLIKILSGLAVEFNGDLFSYISAVESAAVRLCEGLGIASSFSRGKLMTEGHFYPGCPEIIIYSRSNRYSAMDLWYGWKKVTPIEVLTHPVSDPVIWEPAVKNAARLSDSDLVIINIDIPLLAAQWVMWKATNPGGGYEAFLTQVPLVGMMKSHLDICVFNQILALANVKSPGTVTTNLPFAQTAANGYLQTLTREVYERLSQASLTPNQVLSSIPAIFGGNYLDSIRAPDTAPTFQVLWALVSQKVEQAALCLTLGERNGHARMQKELAVIRRTLINEAQDKFMSNGLSTAASAYVQARLNDLVVSKLPKA